MLHSEYDSSSAALELSYSDIGSAELNFHPLKCLSQNIYKETRNVYVNGKQQLVSFRDGWVTPIEDWKYRIIHTRTPIGYHLMLEGASE